MQAAALLTLQILDSIMLEECKQGAGGSIAHFTDMRLHYVGRV